MSRIGGVVAARSLGGGHRLTTWDGETVTVILHPVPPSWDPFVEDVPEGATTFDYKALTKDERDRLFAAGACEVTAFAPLTLIESKL